jgi:colanic acid biosynthesis glycosyl transferase WcaI
VRILIHGINYSPELTGIGKYTGEMAEWLAVRGHEVRVITAPPYYPEWKIGAGYRNGWRREVGKVGSPCLCADRNDKITDRHGALASHKESLKVYRCPLWVPAKPSGLKRLIHLASFALSSFPVMLRQIFWLPDVVWVVEPPLFCAPQSWLVAQLCGARAWLHVQDFEVDAAFDLGIIKAGWFKRFVLASECWLMRRFDCVSTISTGMLGKLIAKGVASDKAFLFPNWVDVESIRPDVDAGKVMRACLGLPMNSRVALYSGNMGEKQGLEYVVEAARLLADKPDLVFVLCGDGAARQRLQQAAERLPNVRWLPLQPLEKLNGLLNMVDVHLLPQKRGVADLVMPSKLTGIFASGRPVIAMAEQGTTVFEVVSSRGVVVPPEDSRALAEAINGLMVDEVERERLGAAGRQFAVETLGREAILQAFEKKLLELQ